jgi:hypothetical protein
MTCNEIAENIVKMCKENNCIIRPYEGEVSCCIIEKRDLSDGASIDEETQEVEK